MASPRMRRPGGRSKNREGKFYGILDRLGKYIVHIRLPGPEKKKTWIKRIDLESALRLVKICSLRIDEFNALPRHRRDRNVHLFQKETFEESVLQQLDADRNSHQELGIIQRIDMEDSTHDFHDGRIDECMTPTDAPVSSFATDEVGTNLQNSLPQDFGLPFDAELEAAGIRDSVAAVITSEDPLSPPTHRQAGESLVMCWSGPLEFMRELREQELEQEKMQIAKNDLSNKALNQEAATELGTQPTPENKELDTMEDIEGWDELLDSFRLDI